MNKSLSLLLTEKPEDIYRGEMIEKLKKKLTELDTKVKDLKYGISYSIEKIHEHCDELRTKIDLAAEETIQEIQNQREKLIKEVDQEEEAYVRELSDKEALKEELDVSINHLEKSCTDCITKLSDVYIDESEMKTKIDEISIGVELCKVDLDKYLYNNQLVQFEPSEYELEESAIGEISNQTLGCELDLNQLHVITLSIYRLPIADFDFYSDGNILFCFSLSQTIIQISTIICNTKQIINNIQINLFENIKAFKCFLNHDDTMIIMLVTYYDNKSIVYSFDSVNYGILNTFKHLGEIIDIRLNSNHIYCLSKANMSLLLNYNLLPVGSINLDFQYDSSYSEIISIDVTNGYLITCNNKSMLEIIDNRENKIVVRKPFLGTFHSIYDKSIIITYDSINKNLYFYDFKGVIVGRQNLPDTVNPTIIKCKENRVLIYDQLASRLSFLVLE